MPTTTVSLLVIAAFAAGFVDAIAGGGGIITVPALLSTGMDPRLVLATNKGQAVFGSTAGFIAFARHGHIDRSRAGYSFVSALIGSALGAKLVLLINPTLLRPLVLVLLVVAALVSFAKRPQHSEPLGLVKNHPIFAALIVGLLLGAYDGFFGPGTGTFLLLIYAYLFGDELVRASGNAKVANMASNLAAFIVFAYSGSIQWSIALPMGIAQMLGAQLGARVAIKRGAGLVRAMAMFVSAALALRIAWQMLNNS